MNLPARRGFWDRYVGTLLKLGLAAVLLMCGILCLLPGMGHPRWVSYRMQSGHQLQMIGLAMHNYHDTYGQFPPAYTVNKYGEPLHSWRVLILPFLDEKELYEKFDLDAPWFSDANKELISQMPDIYTSPYFRDSRSEGKTPYLAIVDQFEGRTVMLPTKGRQLREIPDGSSNSAMVIDDPGHLATWTKPDDWDPLELLAMAGIDENEMHGIQVLLADAHTEFVGDANRDRLVGMIYCDDERVPPTQY